MRGRRRHSQEHEAVGAIAQVKVDGCVEPAGLQSFDSPARRIHKGDLVADPL
jgi:hypothetical protein